ncbi:hypothetical protein NPIL_299151 [Nephila pilipes]|uniref:Uncharacterized protein n=1 Tax=Nephila pilipes TaxID=299642 RepID=A0A8X6MNL0_NEPPI|nr:hypothetical protein NPIL_299151 [Nephila pilipes]
MIRNGDVRHLVQNGHQLMETCTVQLMGDVVATQREPLQRELLLAETTSAANFTLQRELLAADLLRSGNHFCSGIISAAGTTRSGISAAEPEGLRVVARLSYTRAGFARNICSKNSRAANLGALVVRP